MLFKTISASVYAIDPVEVEVDVGSAYRKDFNVVGPHAGPQRLG
jgi:hypothetical protein